MTPYRHGLLLGLLLPLAMLAEPIALVPANAPAVIPLGQTREFQFGTVPQANTTVLLTIRSRMDFPSLGGSMQFMRLVLNGREIQAAVGRSAPRLLNRPLRAPVAPNLIETWYDAGKEGQERGWKVLYAPDFSAAYSEKYYVGDPYECVLDVTDLTNPVAENRLRIENTTTPSFVQANVTPATGKPELNLVIGALTIEAKPGASPLLALAANPAATVVNRGTPAAGAAAYRGELLPGGGFVVQVAGDSYRFTSSFSYPAAGFNRLLPGGPATDGQPGWTVASTANGVTGQGPDYTVVRTVVFGPRRIEVADAIRNARPDAPLGLCVRHELDLAALKDAPIRLAGNPDPAVNDYISFGNPSVHVVTPAGGLGLVADDDVFRNQAHLYVRPEAAPDAAVAGIRTEMLRLGPGETYTLRWSVYPVAGPDYYDFVNLVRTEWDANYTVLGNWVWGFPGLETMSVEEIRTVLTRERIRYYVTSDWVEWAPNERGTQRISFGTDVLTDYWAGRRQAHREAFAKLRQASPDIRVIAYYNSMRESVAETATRFADSLQTDAAGQTPTTVWTHTGAKNASYVMVPTLENSFGKAMLDVARRYMDEMQTDGLYWDEMEGIQFGQILISYSNPDGHSCLLDPTTWRLQREVGIVPLASRPFHDAVVRLTHERGGLLLCNGPTGSQQTLRDRVQRMTEAQHNDRYAYEGLLQSPLGYMSMTDSWDDYRRVLGLGLLPVVRIRPVLPHDISPYLVPFTPIELHAGYLLGQERLIATHTGTYGWPGQRALVQVRHFSAAGKLTTTDFATTIASEARTAVTLGPQEAIVLERLPLSFGPSDPAPGNAAAWTAEVAQVRYSTAEIALHLRAPQGGILNLGPGEFAQGAGANLKVRLGPVAGSVQTANGTLQIAVPAGFADTLTLSEGL
jgi:hypothetical protein